MIGGAIVGDRGDVTLKVRAAYGKGIRPVQGAIRELAWTGRQYGARRRRSDTEQQAGVEAGADLFVGRHLGFHVTRFDQQATGLIQSVAITMPSRSPSRGGRLDGIGRHVRRVSAAERRRDLESRLGAAELRRLRATVAHRHALAGG